MLGRTLERESIFPLKEERGPERSDLQSWEGWIHLGRNILSLVKGKGMGPILA